MSKFKVGDRVRCVDDADAETFLNRGGEYTVIRPGEDHVIVSGCNAWMRANRFELIPAAPPEPQDLSHVWQVGKTYKTTLEGVTAKVEQLTATYDCGTASDNPHMVSWQRDTGALAGYSRDEKQPHLLPIEVATPATDIGPQSASPSSPARVEAQAREAAKQLDEVDPVNHPPHYTQGSIECIDAIRAALTDDEFRGYCKGNAIKYIWRERHKGGAESVAKAKWYLERMKGGAS
jgi:hypothetical protein